MIEPTDRSRRRADLHALAAAGLVAGIALAMPSAAFAQDTQAADAADTEVSTDYLERLKQCQLKQDDGARLACFDTAVGEMVAANAKGDVQVVDREDVRQTKRQLFGFTLPKVKLFGGDDDEDETSDELFETTITSARYFSSKVAHFTTAEGAVWEMTSIPRRLRTIKPGDSVTFKKASLGYYFVRISGQLGVKGKRIR